MSGDAISSKGVAMYLTKGAVPPYTVKPTAISKSKPAVLTVPAATPPEINFRVTSIAKGATTTFGVSADDFAAMKAAGATPSVTFDGFTGAWAVLNGTQVATMGADGSNQFTVAVDSSAFVDPVPDVNTVNSTYTGPALVYAVGQLVRVSNSGFVSLDGKVFSISATSAGSITLLGSDTSAERGNMSTDVSVEIWDSSQLVRLCLTGFTFNPETPGTTNVGTYCNPSATLPQVAVSAGTATLNGWIDKNDPGYVELIEAADDATQRIFSIVLPQNQGEIVAPITLSQIAWDIPLEGGMAFTATGALGAAPRHLF